jgi:hypothetical protein
MEERVIPEPQRTYVLELLHALGPASGDFVVAGAQAMKFMVERARATKDIDFVLDVVKLRGEPLQLSPRLQQLGYQVVKGSRNFQFEKPIPNSRETMRIEFMAPDEFKLARAQAERLPSPNQNCINSRVGCQTAQNSRRRSG